MPDPSNYNVGWICAIKPEYVAAQAFLDEKHERPSHVSTNDSNIYTLGRLGKHNVVIGTLPDGEYGIAAAVGVAKGMLSSFPNVRIGLMVGIGGGAPSSKNDIRLGDIVVSAPRNGHGGVFQYDFGKTIQDKKFQTVGLLNQPPELLRAALTDIQTEYEMQGHQLDKAINMALDQWPRLRKIYQRPDNSSDKLFKSELVHRETDGADCAINCYDGPSSIVEREKRTSEEDNPAIHYGTIASANQLMKDALVRDRLAAEENLLCFEMEAAGLMNRFPCLVVRGICDYADSHKNKEWQGYAAMTAAAYAKDLLKRIPPNTVEAETKISELVENVLLVSLKTKADTQNLQASSHFDKITKWLSAPDASINLNQARELHQPGTGQWLLDTDRYRSWKTKQGSFLWLYGMPGCGKTILSSTVVADLEKDATISLTLLYFYFNFTDVEKRSTEKAVRSLVDQLYRKSTEARGAVDSLYAIHEKRGGQPSHASLQKLLQTMITRCHEVWIILDGLDECETRSQHTTDGVMPWIKTLRGSLPNIHILTTSRPEWDIKYSIEEWANASDMIPLQPNLVAEDIVAYIDVKVKQMDRWRTQLEIQELIATVLNRRANGSFRWVACQFDALERCLSRKDILRELAALPRTLEETYARILERIYPEHKSDAIRLLQLLTYSPRPLSLAEVVDAIAVEPANKPCFDKRNRMPIPQEVTRLCSSLVSLTGFWPVQIQLAHFSVQEYLKSDRLEPPMAKQLDKTIAATAIVEVCLSYLLELDTSLQRERIIEQHPFAKFSAENWSDFAVVVESSNQGVPNAVKEYYESHDAFELGQMLYRPYGIERHLPGKVASPLCYASCAGLPCSVRMLVKTDQDVGVPYGKFRDALLTASYAGHQGIVEILVDNGAEANAQDALQAASNQGYQGIIELLLQKGANVNAQGGFYGNALYTASFNGHQGCVNVLVNNGADIHAHGGFFGNALEAASNKGHQEIVEILVNNDINVNVQSGLYDDALQTAACHGYQGIVKFLLQKGANINKKHDAGGALHFVSEEGNQEIVEMLLQIGADVNAKGGTYGSALVAASHKGHQDIVRILLENGADTTLQGRYLGNALHAASRAGHEGIVYLLLQNGADVGIWAARAARAAALSRGHEEIAKLIQIHYSME